MLAAWATCAKPTAPKGQEAFDAKMGSQSKIESWSPSILHSNRDRRRFRTQTAIGADSSFEL
jgi:hypothetical protein